MPPGSKFPAAFWQPPLQVKRSLQPQPMSLRAFLESRHATLALATAIAVPLLTAGLYAVYGAPQILSGETECRAPRPRASASLVAQVEARLREHPEDGKGWEVIAPVYLKLGRFREAANAYANAARLKARPPGCWPASPRPPCSPPTASSPRRRASPTRRCCKLEPGRVEPRFWLAMAKEQDGKLAEALADYKALLAEAPADAPYRPPLEQRIARGRPRASPARSPAWPAAPPPPTWPPPPSSIREQRAQMIAQMVDGLAQRLKTQRHATCRLAAPRQRLCRARPQG